MRRNLLLFFFAACMTLALPSTLLATSNGFYLSWKLGTSDADASVGDSFHQVLNGDQDSKTWELGFRFTRFWAVQAGYHDFGNLSGFFDPCPEGDEACDGVVVPIAGDTTGYSLAVLPQLPLGNRLSVFGKVGVIAWKSDVEAADGAAELVRNFDRDALIYGVGARFKLIGAFEVFGEWEKVASDLETVSLGLTFQF